MAMFRQMHQRVSVDLDKTPFLRRGYVRPGTFIAAVGADSPDKQELDTALLQGTTVVADILEQCLHAGEIQIVAVRQHD